MANKCKECGCTCKRCLASDHDVQLHVEIENLKQHLLEKDNHIVMMETNFLNEANKFPSGELVAVREELLMWQDKYRRLYDAHRRVQRVNQGLEDKLLKLVDVSETEKTTLTKDIATLSHNLAEANYAIKKLTEDNERYKNDVTLAIQFLQCKQTNFVAHRFDTLPSEVQSQVATYMNNKRSPDVKKTPPEIRSIKVPIPTFPPTAMVYSVPKSPKPDRKPVEEDVQSSEVDIVSAAIMAKVLEERQKERALAKHCDTCTCSKGLKIVHDVSQHHVGTQTRGEYKENSCLKCNGELITGNDTGLKIVRTNEDKLKKLPIYPASSEELNPNLNQNNVVKVQPNNFLNNSIQVYNRSSNLCVVNRSVPLIHPSNSSVANSSIPVFNGPSNVCVENRFAPLNHPSNSSVATSSIPFPNGPSNVCLENRSFPLNGSSNLCVANNTGNLNVSNSSNITLTPSVQDVEILSTNYVKSNANSNSTPSKQDATAVEKESSLNQDHHKLCDKQSPKFEVVIENYGLLKDSENNSAKNTSSENLRGPRYCSLRLQTGSRNILLDNTHNNVAPVLYTRSHKIKSPQIFEKVEVESLSSCEKNTTSFQSTDSSLRNQKRVAEWIQTNLEHGNNVSSSENSRVESLKSSGLDENLLDKVKLAEMEENVKRFLFGESEFMKTVELGKLKYQSFRDENKDCMTAEKSGDSRTTSFHAETEI